MHTQTAHFTKNDYGWCAVTTKAVTNVCHDVKPVFIASYTSKNRYQRQQRFLFWPYISYFSHHKQICLRRMLHKAFVARDRCWGCSHDPFQSYKTLRLPFPSFNVNLMPPVMIKRCKHTCQTSYNDTSRYCYSMCTIKNAEWAFHCVTVYTVYIRKKKLFPENPGK